MKTNVLKKILKLKKRLIETNTVFQKNLNVRYKSTSYNYFDINQIHEKIDSFLFEFNLALTNHIRYDEEHYKSPVLEVLLCDLDTGETISNVLPIPNPSDINYDYQKLGSAITYFRRYGLVALLGLQAEDDDGNSITGNGKVEIKQKYSTNAKQHLKFVLDKIYKDKGILGVEDFIESDTGQNLLSKAMSSKEQVLSYYKNLD